jgi:restriction system protein
MNLNEVVLFFMLYKYEILLIIFIPFLVFLIFLAFPRIEKKFNEKDKLIDEKDETLSGARGHYKELLIEVKTLKIEKEKLITENNDLKQKILELEEYEKKIKKITFEENRKEKFKNHLKNISNKGKEFEEFVAGHFKLDGYQINSNGIKQGKKDKGIDIICSKDEELILIQCKNWKEDSKYKINHEKLKAFVGCCTEYINEHKLFDKKVKLKFITSNYILDESGKKFLEESKTLQYEILKY